MSTRGKGFASTIRVKEAQQILQSKLSEITETETISVFESHKRKLAGDIIAEINLPGFKRSAMDGFAVKARNTYGATDTSPIQLHVIGKVEIGDTEILSLEEGQAIEISTGAPLPNGADAVIRLEVCEKLDSIIELYSSVPIGKNVANEDEDVKRGELIFSNGHVVLPWDQALLISLNISKVEVYRKPRVAILSTGSELVSVDSKPKIGQVVDSNRPALESWCKQMGVEIVCSDTCEDEVSSIKNKINSMPDYDLIITTGGTSVGSKDYMAEIISDLGTMWINGVSIRPGKPVILGEIHGKLIIALPGYPLAAFLNFDLFAAYAIKYWTGNPSYWEHETEVVLAQPIASSSGVRDMVRLRSGEEGAQLLRVTGAGILTSLTKADYLLEIAEDLEGYNKGSIVKVRELRK
ncbi:MAG: molybdopterin molybdotransferase MoeA [Candidatus Heimdallarchaeota archaeon]|nr:molybdopterin molybdotransferase MoeA [Candidatus Heimdallarchaeota archaeon]